MHEMWTTHTDEATPMPERDRFIGDIADLVGCQSWRLRRLAERGLIPSRKIGRQLVFDVADVPAIQAVARQAGILMADRQAVGV